MNCGSVFRSSLLFFVVVSINGCATSKKTDSQLNLCQSYQDDLQFIHEQLKENSSNYHYDNQVAAQADQVAEVNLNKPCSGKLDYIKSIRNYAATYKDPHLKVKILVDLQSYNAGIYLKKFDSKYVVWDFLPEIKQIEKGDELVSCDGLSPEQILNEIVIPYESVNSPEMFKASNAYRIFYRWDIDPKASYSCEFKGSNGKLKALVLEWKKTSNDDLLLNRFYRANERSIYEIQKYKWGHYIRLSAMYAGNDQQDKLLEKFVEEAKKLKKDKAILLDLRGNGGGDSSYGDRWLRNLIGYSPELDSKPEMIWTSKGNVQHFDSYIEKSLAKASEHERKDLTAFRNCLHSGSNKFVTCDDEQIKPKMNYHKSGSSKVFVLTDERCFSSCEIFLAKLRKLKNVVHIGHDAGQSTLFGDVRTLKSPSENIQLTFPQKVFFYASDEGFRKPQVYLSYKVSDEILGKDSLKEQAVVIVEGKGNL